MKQKIRHEGLEVRLMNRAELCSYLGMGVNLAVAFAKEHNAEVRVGKRRVYDKKVLDKVLDDKAKMSPMVKQGV